MKENPKVAIIIPTYGDYIEDTLKAVKSSIEADYHNKFIIVVDDGSDKEIQLELKKEIISQSPEVIVELASENKGFAGACNIGAKIAENNKAGLLFFLNNDAVIKEDAIGYMVEEFNNKNVAIVGPKIYLGRTKILNSVGGYFDKKTLLKKEYGCKVEDVGQSDERREVEFVMGSAFMVSTQFYKQFNGMDENFFMYTEETDFCFRVIKAGYKIIYQPKAVVWHEHGKTMGKFNNRIMYYCIRNGIYFVKKNGSLWNVINMIFYFNISYLKSIFKIFVKSIIVFYLAVVDGLSGNTGRKKSRLLK